MESHPRRPDDHRLPRLQRKWATHLPLLLFPARSSLFALLTSIETAPGSDGSHRFARITRQRAGIVKACYPPGVDTFLAEGRRVTAIGMALNGGLALVKLVTGLVGHSDALVADAVESLGDICSSAIVWGGLSIASKPADENHPYGHGKAEPLAALAVALMLIAAAGGIAVQAIHAIRVPHPTPAAYTLAVLIGVIVVKEAMYRYQMRTGGRLSSGAIIVDAWHHRSDAITSAVAGVGIAIALIGGPGYSAADDWAALAASVVIVANGARFVRSSIGELMDVRPQTSLIDTIEAAVSETDQAQRTEKVLVRKMGPRLYVDLHLEVNAKMSVLRAHEIAHEVKRRITERRPDVADVMVHVEPYGGSGQPEESQT